MTFHADFLVSRIQRKNPHDSRRPSDKIMMMMEETQFKSNDVEAHSLWL